jgi:hypothetical protein
MWFAECLFRALDKKALCRVLNKKQSAKKNTRQRSCFAECKKNTRQRSCFECFFWHSAKQFFKAHFEALNEFKLKSF